MTARFPRWKPAPDGLRIVLVSPEGEILEAPPTRYGTVARIKEAAAAKNREAKEARSAK